MRWKKHLQGNSRNRGVLGASVLRTVCIGTKAVQYTCHSMQALYAHYMHTAAAY